MLSSAASIQLCHLFEQIGIRSVGGTDLCSVFRCELHSKIAPCCTSNVVFRVQGINIMLLSCQEIFNVINVLKNNKIERIRPIVVVSALQRRVLMLACLQITKMMLFAMKQIFCRANIPMLIDTIDNGVNAWSSRKIGGFLGSTTHYGRTSNSFVMSRDACNIAHATSSFDAPYHTTNWPHKQFHTVQSSILLGGKYEWLHR